MQTIISAYIGFFFIKLALMHAMENVNCMSFVSSLFPLKLTMPKETLKPLYDLPVNFKFSNVPHASLLSGSVQCVLMLQQAVRVRWFSPTSHHSTCQAMCC